LKFLKKLMKRYGKPDRVVTDKLRSFWGGDERNRERQSAA